MDRILELLTEHPNGRAMEEEIDDNTKIPHRGIIIIGCGSAGLVLAMNHLIHSCSPTLAVHDLGEVGAMGHSLINSEEPSHAKIDDGFFQHLVEDMTFKITALKEEIYESMTYEYFETRIQHIKNYRQPKIGRLNTKPKQIWWHRSHQRI